MQDSPEVIAEKVQVMKIANRYLQDVRRWKEGEYTVRYRRKEGTLHRVYGHLIKDEREAEELKKSKPGRWFIRYPSEFALLIDLEKAEVIEDSRIGEEETHPRP